ncbi:hypothetical protein A3860_35090 [Niastella vici]|uniref:TonB C-terminal domain-containing protein n=1 Tax=Niastella vici TaxID=1703345 RepID=A0A1V9FNT5_9BACT|nr:hypothetical protein [Niastella vici]OQP60000.1 hypothetical protein A3860_35090 [Niastella vici]
MKSFQLILLCLVCVAKSYGQGGRIVVEITKEKHKSYTIKVIQWVNPRADSSWLPSIEKDLNRSIPANKHIKKGKYVVSARFIADKDGNICEVECENDPGFGIGADVVRALKKSGKWVSGKGYIVQPYKH